MYNYLIGHVYNQYLYKYIHTYIIEQYNYIFVTNKSEFITKY